LGELFTADAWADPSLLPAFTAEDVTITEATVRFRGIATVDQDAATSATLAVDFTGTGHAGGPAAPVRLDQSGELLCVRTDQGWRVGGYDVHLNEKRVAAEQATTSPQAAKFVPSPATRPA
jgi:uncharacterized protein YhdP